MNTEKQPGENDSFLTEEQRSRMEEWLRAHPYGDQDENGIDLSLIRKNMRLTPAERLEQLQRAHNAFAKVGDGRTTN